MSQEVFKMIQGAGWKDVEMQIAYHCAPLIAGLKPSNLLMLACEDIDKMKNILKHAGISYFIVAVTERKAAVLLFDRHWLDHYLQDGKVWQIFLNMGYREYALGKILYAFRLRYENYLKLNRDFPHEMGLLLGYPVEDVEGFIRNEGENCLYNGYWKVYENPSEKKVLFYQFERARDAVIRLMSDGVGIVEIMQRRLLVQNIC